MAYRLRYQFWVDEVPPGLSVFDNPSGPGTTGGPAQTLAFFAASNGVVSSTFTAPDITTLTNAAASDMSTQLNAAISRIQGFASGGG